MEFKYLLLSVIFVVFATPHYSYSAAARAGHRYKFVPSILIPDRIIQRLEQRQKSFRCTSEGYFGDPNDCTKFYRCVPNPGSPNYFDQYSFECPPGTAFDDRIKTCNFISAVPGCEGTTSSPSMPGLQPTTSITTVKPTQTVPSTTISTFPPFSTDSTTTQDSLVVTGTTLTSIESTTASSTISEEISTETVASAESTTERPSSTPTDGTTVTILDSTTTKVTTEPITDSLTESTTTEGTTTIDSSDITGTTPDSSATIEPTPDSSTPQESTTEETSTAVSSLEITGTTPTLIGSTTTESSTADSTTEITTTDATISTSPTFPSTMFSSTTEPSIITELFDEFSSSTESTTLIPPSLTLDMSTTLDPLTTTENTVSTLDSSAFPSTLPPLPSLAELLTLVDCSQDSSGMMDLSLKRVPNNCNIFYQCVFNEGAKPGISLFSCPDGQLFDEPSATCKNPGDTTPCSPPIVPPQPTGNMTAEFSDLASQLCQDETFHRFPTNCNFFFQCLKSGSAYKLHLFACPGGLVYDEPTSTCQTPENSTPCRNLNEPTTPSPILFTLMPASQYNCIIPGNFPYELDCDHFYRCFEVLPGVLNGLLYQCPVGYSFSTVSERCELKQSQPICQRRRPNDRRRFPTGGIRLNVQDLPFFFRY